jgi:N-acyl-D-aspartate/D-glutamate deacylase
MTSAPDLVIRGGNIADGKGGDLYEADVAITGGRITEVGKVAGKGKEEIDAKGKLVAPGFVDVHTHYDGQVTWSQDITPSSQNGVTTAIMGNYDRGVIAPGFKADVNVIDYDKLHLHPPKVHYDLPVGGRRLMQQVDGYDLTIVSGVVTQRGGAATGARPGRLVRGAQGTQSQFGAAAN